MPPPHSAADISLPLASPWLSARETPLADHQITAKSAASVVAWIRPIVVVLALAHLATAVLLSSSFLAGLPLSVSFLRHLSAFTGMPFAGGGSGNAGAHHAGTDNRHLLTWDHRCSIAKMARISSNRKT